MLREELSTPEEVRDSTLKDIDSLLDLSDIREEPTSTRVFATEETSTRTSEEWTTPGEPSMLERELTTSETREDLTTGFSEVSREELKQ
jgi:hypothetical protein